MHFIDLVRRLVSCLIMIIATATAVVPQSEVTSLKRYIVKFHSGDTYASLLGGSGTKVVGGIHELNVTVMEFDSDEEAQKWVHGRSDVVYIERDSLFHLAMSEGTPYGINLVNAHEIPNYVSGSGIKMCIIDSGYAVGHEDLPNPNNGDPVTGRSGLCNNGDCPWDVDPNGHGTHVAGTIVATGDNGKGVIGIVKTTKMPLHIVRVLNSRGRGRSVDLANALLDCDNNGAHVVNMSLGGSILPRVIQETIHFILERNNRILFVAAAGNGGDSSYNWPASMPEVVSVASLDSNKTRSFFSQHNDQVDLSCPGSFVISTVPPNNYAVFSGTSMATPHVAGVAAKIWSHAPSMTAHEVRELLESTAEDLGVSGRDDFYGWGLIDALDAYEALLGPASPSTSPTPTLSPSVSSAPISSPSASPSIRCYHGGGSDSAANFLWNNNKLRGCKFIANRKDLCNQDRFKLFCPTTCGASEYKCDDANIPFYLGGLMDRQWTCNKLANILTEKRERKCLMPKFYQTCRKTCKVCDGRHRGELVSIDFDENGDGTAEYFRSDIQLENYWSTNREQMYYGSGFDYGTISEPNVGFNGWAKPMTMSCPGGNFSLRSLWITPVWSNEYGLVVTLDSSAKGSLKNTYSISLLSNTLSTKLESEVMNFTEIDYLIISTNSTQVAVDDMMIEIINPCADMSNPGS